MTFSGKFPKSRRQVWEEANSASRYSHFLRQHSKEDYSAEKNHRDEPDTTDSSYVLASAGAPAPYRGRGVTKLSDKFQPFALPESSAQVTFKTKDKKKDGRLSTGKLQTAEPSDVKECVQAGGGDFIDTPVKISFSRVDILFICVSVILYIVDIGLDCFVAYKHYRHIKEEPLYFAFTLVFVLLSGIITSIFSILWYYFEYHDKRDVTPEDLPTRSGLTLRIVACVFMMGPVVRYIDTIIYGVKSRAKGITSEKRQYFHEQMQFERVDGAMLRLFEAFLESAPQFLLQVFIVLREGLDGEKEGDYFLVTVTIASITSSMISLSWSVVAYHKALRMSRDELKNINHIGLSFRFLWRLFEISPRIIILAMFMSAFGFYVGILAAVHWLIMIIWLSQLRTKFCKPPSCELLFVAVLAFIWSFCFFNVKDGHTRRTSLVYYILFYTENVVMCIAWYFKTIDEDMWYRPIIISVVLGSVLPMVAFMLIYYKCLHRENIKNCLPMSYWTSCRPAKSSTSKRYGPHEGKGVERERLTSSSKGDAAPSAAAHIKAAPPPSVDELNNVDELCNREADVDDSEPPLTSMPAYPAPAAPGEPNSFAVLDDVVSKEETPNLDDCVEVNGYLECSAPMKTLAKLTRQDTMPRYLAPVPSNYGITVPGGAPAVYTLAVSTPPNPLHGTTLPGAPAVATLVSSERSVVHCDGEDSPPLHPRHSTFSKSVKDKPPVPQPRLSSIHHTDNDANQSESTIHGDSQSQLQDESFLTTVSDLSGDDSTFLLQTLTPRKSVIDDTLNNSHDLSRSSLDDSLVAAASSVAEKSASGDGSLQRKTLLNASVQSEDTPLKEGHGPAVNSLDLSIDTPVKDAMLARSTRGSQ